MSEHTKEPWQIMRGPNSFDISGEDEIPIAVMVADDDVNARRIVACVNACAGIDNEMLEDDCFNKMRQDRNELLQQRDELQREVTALKSGLYDSVLPKVMQQRDELLKTLKMAQTAINNGVGGMIAGSLMQTHIAATIAKVEASK